MKALTLDAGEAHRRAAAMSRLAAYDREVAALVTCLRAVAARLEVGEIGPDDAARLRKEAECLARRLPSSVPLYPTADPDD